MSISSVYDEVNSETYAFQWEAFPHKARGEGLSLVVLQSVETILGGFQIRGIRNHCKL